MFNWLKRELTQTPIKTDDQLSTARTDSQTAPIKSTVEAVIPLVREDIAIGKKRVEGDRVRVHVETLTDVETVEEDLLLGAVEVDRIEKNQPLTELPAIREDGDITIIPVVKERLVLKKELVLVEEIHIKRSQSRQTVRRDVEVRRQEPRIERVDG